ncbi:MAG TPA: sugar ABC transporter ATP-binding protein [Geminicoccaceae bacterium]|nr:sugar ABC transporter ATP-binding protein [Geminicoccaceae bacterium]
MASPMLRADDASGPLLHLENISKRFGGVQALADVSFEIQPGEVHCLAGENGCGKSTLIKIISGVYAPDPGAVILFAGEPLAELNPVRARELGVQVIWQDLALFPELSVAENIAIEQNLGDRPRWVNRSRMREVARAAIQRLGFALDLDRPVRELSIARRQMVAICRALAADARIVFMDEPTASLTQTETDALLEVIRRLSSDGIAVVLVSHRLAEVLEVCERVTVLRDGRLVGVFPTAGMTQAHLTELMTGQTFETGLRQRDLATAPVVLEARQLSRRGEYADISFSLRRGETLGLTGLLGAGRTELALTLFGMTRPDSGEIRLEGKPVSLASNRDAIDAGIAYVSEDRLTLGLVQPQSIADNTVITVLDRLVSALRLIDPKRKAELVDDWVRRLGVKIGQPTDAVSTLSGGNQQRVVLAKWLATNPKVLILDAPTVGVDVGAREGIFRIVRDLAEAGMAILLISDEIPEVYVNADRVLHMRDGRIVQAFVPAETEIKRIEDAVHA